MIYKITGAFFLAGAVLAGGVAHLLIFNGLIGVIVGGRTKLVRLFTS